MYKKMIPVVFLAVFAKMASAALVLSGASVFPALVVEDSAGSPNVLGQVIGFQDFRPLVQMTDGTDTVLLRVSKNFLTTRQRVFYSGNDCTGTAFLPTFTAGTSQNATGSFEEITGVVFAVGKPAVADDLGILYKSDGVITQPVIQSAWITMNTPPTCFVNGSGSGQDKFGVIEVQDLDTLFTPPFKFDE